MRLLTTLTVSALSRLERHLESARPIVADFGWAGPDGPAERGCLVGVTLSKSDYLSLRSREEGQDVVELAEWVFPSWIGRYVSQVDEELADEGRSRLREIVRLAVGRLPDRAPESYEDGVMPPDVHR